MLDKLEPKSKNAANKFERKPRLGRLEVVRRGHESQNRTPHYDEHSWAVSYADFLMVLLSFFVIFFGQSDGVDNIILKITQEISKDGGSKSGSSHQASQATESSGKHAGSFSGAGPLEREVLTKQLQQEFTGFQISESEKENALSILLPENIYQKGQFKLSEESKKQFEDLAKRLLPFKESIFITVTGHTDDVSVTPSSLKKFDDNTELSSLRAYYATKNLIEMGFSEDQVRIKTLLKEHRNSRTLSIHVTGVTPR